MVDLAAFREGKAQLLSSLLVRPGMHWIDAQDLEIAGVQLLRDLVVLDDGTWPEWVGPTLGRFGKMGISGAFVGTFGKAQYHAEVVSVLAEIAFRMGLYQPPGPILEENANEFSERLRELWWDRDVVFDSALEQLPEPTMLTEKRVVSFAPAAGPWIHLDFESERFTRYDPHAGREVHGEGELLLRNLRVHADSFDEGIVLTMFGRYRRYGPASWIRQPPRRHDPPQVVAIAAQLREIEDSDPSHGR